MATIRECRKALDRFSENLARAEGDVRNAAALERSLSCRITDLDITFVGRLADSRIHDVTTVHGMPTERAQIRLAMAGDDLVALVEGRLNFARAWASGRVKLEAGLRDQFGKRTLHEVVSGERDALMGDITASLNRMAQKELGIEVIDVRVKAIDLPKEVNRSVFERMSTEREREAREHRAKGRELAEGIRADADRQRRVLLAEAYRQSEETRGEGDAKAAAIYAKAYNQDPEFYAFTRSLKAYRDSFADKKDVLVLSPDNEFFRYLEKSKP